MISQKEKWIFWILKRNHQRSVWSNKFTKSRNRPNRWLMFRGVENKMAKSSLSLLRSQIISPPPMKHLIIPIINPRLGVDFCCCIVDLVFYCCCRVLPSAAIINFYWFYNRRRILWKTLAEATCQVYIANARSWGACGKKCRERKICS